MLQRVVWNRVEFKVSPLGGSDFTDVDDGSFCPNEQAQTPRIRKKCRLDHVWEEPLPLGSYEISSRKFWENFANRKLANTRELGQIQNSTMRVTAQYDVRIKQLKVMGRVGVTKAERSRRQKLLLNLTLWPVRDLRDLGDAVERAVNYSAVAREAKAFVSKQSPKLIETLGDDLASHLMRKFRIRQIHVEIRKFVLQDAAYVSVGVTRTASLD